MLRLLYLITTPNTSSAGSLRSCRNDSMTIPRSSTWWPGTLIKPTWPVPGRDRRRQSRRCHAVSAGTGCVPGRLSEYARIRGRRWRLCQPRQCSPGTPAWGETCGVQQICGSGTSRDGVKEKTFAALRNFRAGVEGNICELKRVFGLDRARWKGQEGFNAYVWSSVLSDNLMRWVRFCPG